jgi:hypothetical protein
VFCVDSLVLQLDSIAFAKVYVLQANYYGSYFIMGYTLHFLINSYGNEIYYQ